MVMSRESDLGCASFFVTFQSFDFLVNGMEFGVGNYLVGLNLLERVLCLCNFVLRLLELSRRFGGILDSLIINGLLMLELTQTYQLSTPFPSTHFRLPKQRLRGMHSAPHHP